MPEFGKNFFMGHFTGDTVTLVAVFPAGVGTRVSALSDLGTGSEMTDHFFRLLPAFFSGFMLAGRVCEVVNVLAFPHNGLRALLLVRGWVATRAETVRNRVVAFCMGMSLTADSLACVFFAIILVSTILLTFNVLVILVTLFDDLVVTF